MAENEREWRAKSTSQVIVKLEKERRKKMQKRFGKGTKKGNGLKYQKIDQSTMLIIKY